MKRIASILIFLVSITFLCSFSKPKIQNVIIGNWCGKTYILFRVDIQAHFDNNNRFDLKVTVFGNDYDRVKGKYKINDKFLILRGVRRRTNKKQELIFKIEQMHQNFIKLKLLYDDGKEPGFLYSAPYEFNR